MNLFFTKKLNSFLVDLVILGMAVALILAWIFLGSHAAHAQEVGLTISPLTFELTADPGDTITNELRVFNPTSNRFSVDMDVEDFTATGELGSVIVETTEDETYSLKKWVVFDPPTFSLDPGEKQFVRFVINVPAEAEPGGHYGSILATIKASIGEVSGTGVTSKVGALVLLSVPGTVTENLIVEEFSAPDFQEGGPVPFVARFSNTGSVHVRPIGFVQITNLLGRKVEDVPFPQKNVIPGAKRLVEFDWLPSGFTAGRYTASLVGHYGQTNIPLSAVTTFWVLPWKQLSVLGFGLLVGLFLLIKMRKRLTLALSVLARGEKV